MSKNRKMNNLKNKANGMFARPQNREQRRNNNRNNYRGNHQGVRTIGQIRMYNVNEKYLKCKSTRTAPLLNKDPAVFYTKHQKLV